jgi:DNA repair photolyase
MNEKTNYIKGRGAQINPDNPFDKHTRQQDSFISEEDVDNLHAHKATSYIKTNPKSIINKVESPDIGHGYSLNPYQGCEHGCVYCYARNTHTYWGYSSGIEFEQKILIKESAPALLEEKLKSKSWKPIPIMLSGNTDCYQPAEKKYQITRQILEVLWKYRHPVGLITKSALILRDIELLSMMAKENLLHVAISITSLDEGIRQKLEPRAASGKKRLDVVRSLADEQIPVNVMFAPIIPSINDTEVFDIAEKSAEAGARSFNYTMVRLNGDVSEIFKDWLMKNYPERYDRVIHQIENSHGGKVSDSRFGTRMRGEGNVADIINQQVRLAKEKFFKDKHTPAYNTTLYELYKDRQLTLF